MQMTLVKYWYLSFHIFFLSMLFPKEINIESIEIDSKSNGIIVNVKMDSMLGKNDLTAWQANSGWFYITLYKAKGDTLSLKSNELPSEVIDYQVIQGDESFQIGLRLRRNIESHEFLFVNKNTLTIPLRYSTEYFSSLGISGISAGLAGLIIAQKSEVFHKENTSVKETNFQYLSTVNRIVFAKKFFKNYLILVYIYIIKDILKNFILFRINRNFQIIRFLFS